MADDGVLPDPTGPPDEAEIRSVVGGGWPRWRGCATGWPRPRFRRSGRALATLAPHAGSFSALVVIGPRLWAEVEQLPLSSPVRSAWARARPCPDGRWIFLEVADDQTVTDTERLGTLKSPPPRWRVAPDRRTAGAAAR